MDDDLFVIPSDNILIGEADGVFVGGDQDLLSESESIVGPPGPPGPAGRDGKDGVDGQSATVTVGSTTTTAPGTDAIVTNVGDNLNAVLNFSIPRGAVGETGPSGADGVDGVDGSDGFSPIATVTQTEYGASISITDSNGTTTAQVVNGSQGEPGTPGASATVSVGSTTTGAAGTSASVVNSGTSSAAVLDFVIPRGADGTDGIDGYSPTATVTQNTGSATITITDKNGTTTATVYDGVSPSISSIVDVIYPVGSIYMSVNNTNPGTFLSGTWQQIQDTFLLAAGSTYAAGSTGGSATHKHRTPFIASHNSTDTALRLNRALADEWVYQQAAISNTPKFNNAGNVSWGGNDIIYTSDTSTLPPYLAVYVWKRIS